MARPVPLEHGVGVRNNRKGRCVPGSTRARRARGTLSHGLVVRHSRPSQAKLRAISRPGAREFRRLLEDVSAQFEGRLVDPSSLVHALSRPLVLNDQLCAEDARRALDCPVPERVRFAPGVSADVSRRRDVRDGFANFLARF